MHPQLDLRIVGRQQLEALRSHERAADAAAVLGAYRDVLQVRIRRGQAAGGGTGLVVAGVHAAGVRVDHLRQLVGVGAAQLGQAAVLQDHPRQLVLLGNRLQRLFIGAGLALGGLHHRRQLQLIEQHRLQLLGRIQVEAAPGQLGGLLLRGQHARGQVLALPAQFVGVDPHAIGFDAGQHRHQRHLDVAVHAVQRRLGQQLRLQRVVQAQGDVGVFGGVAAGLVDAHLRERGSAWRPCRPPPRT